jgi:hypothetical protein
VGNYRSPRQARREMLTQSGPCAHAINALQNPDCSVTHAQQGLSRCTPVTFITGECCFAPPRGTGHFEPSSRAVDQDYAVGARPLWIAVVWNSVPMGYTARLNTLNTPNGLRTSPSVVYVQFPIATAGHHDILCAQRRLTERVSVATRADGDLGKRWPRHCGIRRVGQCQL